MLGQEVRILLQRKTIGIVVAGAAAGAVAGLFGAGGGMVLVPLLTLLTRIADDQIFPTSVSIMLPICFVILISRAGEVPPSFFLALPYLLGSIPGGILAGITGNRIPTIWLHRALGLLIIWGGIRYLC